jgi:hypothetical protein
MAEALARIRPEVAPRRVGLRRRGSPRPRGDNRPRPPRQPVFLRSPRLPQPRRPEAALGITTRRRNRHHPERRRPARPRTIDLRHVLHHPRRSTSRFSAEGRASCFSSEVPERAPLTDSDQQSSFAKSGSISAGSRRTAAIAAEGTDGCWAPGGPRQNNVARAPADFCVP